MRAGYSATSNGKMAKRLVADRRHGCVETGPPVSIHQSVWGALIPSENHAVALEPLKFEECHRATESGAPRVKGVPRRASRDLPAPATADIQHDAGPTGRPPAPA